MLLTYFLNIIFRPYMNFADHGYRGEMLNGQKHGFGTLTCDNGDVYEGMFINDEQEGKGVFTYSNGYKYDGDFLKGKWHGQGKFTFADGGYYAGDFRAGKFHGNGTFVFAHGDKYDGYVVDNMRHGKGKYTFANKNIFEGEFLKNKMISGILHCDISSHNDVNNAKSSFHAVFDNDVDKKYMGSIDNVGGLIPVSLTKMNELGNGVLRGWFHTDGTFVSEQ